MLGELFGSFCHTGEEGEDLHSKDLLINLGIINIEDARKRGMKNEPTRGEWVVSGPGKAP